MNQQDFEMWVEDLKRKAPGLGGWVARLPTPTIREWFVEVFSEIELRDAEQVNREIRSGDIDLEGFRRDGLCAVFIRRCYELKAARSERFELARQRNGDSSSRTLGVLSGIEADPVMGPAYRRTAAKIREWQKANPGAGRLPPDELVSEWVTDAMASDLEGDPERQPRYRCVICCDTGFARTPCKQFVGHCKCSRGTDRLATNWRHGRRLGPAVEPRKDEVFE